MNSIFQQILIEATKRRMHNEKSPLPDNNFKNELKETRVVIKHLFRDWLFIGLGIISAALGLKSFLLPNSFIDGGVTGISLIIAELSHIPFSILLVIINIPFVILAYSTISKTFAFRSIIAIVILAFCLHFIDFPVVTDDKLLIAGFGGFFLGLGIGLAIRGGAVLDGTEVLAVYVSRKTSITIGDIILIFNVLIFSVGAYVFSVEIALYAILTYLAASKTVDFVVSGIEEYIGVTIISESHEAIRLSIIEKLGRGCTIYSGKRGYAKKGIALRETNIIYTLITRLELSELQTEVEKIDKDAFMIMQSIKDAKGGMIKKRPLK
ncbi:MAG: YitT family protein [Leeuwenhoekiella sp.]